MNLVDVRPEDLESSPDLQRSGSAKLFEERLRSSIEQVGLAEPIKVALMPSGKYLVVDGAMRLQAIRRIREQDPEAFFTIPAYVIDYSRRYEIRYQSDIYQDLLPSQLATLVEHLHKAEQIKKSEIASYIGVSPATLRNYTGLWRMIQRGGLFSRVVEMMDAGVFPSSNPFAWLRLTDRGLRMVLEDLAGPGQPVEEWATRMVASGQGRRAAMFSVSEVEAMTGRLPDGCYREDSRLRDVKKSLGTRRSLRGTTGNWTPARAVQRAAKVARTADDPVLRSAAGSLREYLQ